MSCLKLYPHPLISTCYDHFTDGSTPNTRTTVLQQQMKIYYLFFVYQFYVSFLLLFPNSFNFVKFLQFFFFLISTPSPINSPVPPEKCLKCKTTFDFFQVGTLLHLFPCRLRFRTISFSKPTTIKLFLQEFRPRPTCPPFGHRTPYPSLLVS